MLNEKIASLINTQVNKEFYSAYLYLEFANYCEELGLDGFAHWYEIQAKEERNHAIIFRRYLLDNGYRVTMEEIQKPTIELNSAMDVFKAGLKHEQYVTALINEIYSEAFTQHDFKSMQFLDWFIKEQVEEEKNAEDLVKKMELFGNDPKSLYLLNQELNTRVYTPTPMLNGE